MSATPTNKKVKHPVTGMPYGHISFIGNHGVALPMPTTLAEWRKQRPVYEGFIKYFPDAIMECSHLSLQGNAQHGKEGDPLQWYKEKSTDEKDCIVRHLIDLSQGDTDDDGIWQEVKAMWRACANVQRKIDALRKEGLYPPKFNQS